MSMYIIIQTIFLYYFNRVYVFYEANTTVRVVREYPNPKFWVPEFSGIVKPVVISGIDSENPKFKIPELPDLKFSGNPNAHP
jgi:hypothetical protein